MFTLVEVDPSSATETGDHLVFLFPVVVKCMLNIQVGPVSSNDVCSWVVKFIEDVRNLMAVRLVALVWTIMNL